MIPDIINQAAAESKRIKVLKLSKQKKLTPKLEDKVNQPEFLIEYFAGIKKGDFYEEPVEGEYPDWQLQ